MDTIIATPHVNRRIINCCTICYMKCSTNEEIDNKRMEIWTHPMKRVFYTKK